MKSFTPRPRDLQNYAWGTPDISLTKNCARAKRRLESRHHDDCPDLDALPASPHFTLISLLSSLPSLLNSLIRLTRKGLTIVTILRPQTTIGCQNITNMLSFATFGITFFVAMVAISTVITLLEW